jgi:hypothetical protein
LNSGAAIVLPHQLSVIDAASAPLPLILIKADSLSLKNLPRCDLPVDATAPQPGYMR